MNLKLGILLPTRGLVMGSDEPPSIEPLLAMAELAEQAGLDSVWVGDSLTAKPRLEPLTTLSAIAMRTRRVRLGTAVMLPALRHPVSLAQMAATVDTVSGGRLILGAGVGGAFNDAQQREWLNVGVKPSRRASRFEEVLEITNRLTSGESVTFAGKHFALDDVSVRLRALQPDGVPFLVACHWRAGRERQFQRAAKLGAGFMSISDYPDEYARVVDRVRGYTAEYGADPDAPEATYYMTVNLREDEAAAGEEADTFLHQYYGANIWGDRWGPFGNPRRVAERISQYGEAGAQTVIVRFASFEQERQLDTFLSEIVPQFG
ncbi:MAG: LLM class flavin-dependent oxidoreductase [Chloroflexi bacterium]|nr:LLM class flavin-dependent oxidoreductase [Chloroflexota bacterium]